MGEGEPSMEQESKENNKNLFTKPLTFYMLQMRTPGMLEERNPQMDIGVEEQPQLQRWIVGPVCAVAIKDIYSEIKFLY